jgi:hypothetical protein
VNIFLHCVHPPTPFNASNIFTYFTFTYYPPSLICDLPFAWPVFHNITVFVLGLYSTSERKHAAFGLQNLAKFT